MVIPWGCFWKEGRKVRNEGGRKEGKERRNVRRVRKEGGEGRKEGRKEGRTVRKKGR